MTIERRLGRLEALVSATAPSDEPEPPAWWQALFGEQMRLLLATMPENRTEQVVELINAGRWPEDPVSFRAADRVLGAIPRAEPRWFDQQIRGWVCTRPPVKSPLALPGPVCDVLAADPALVRLPYIDSCVRCAYEVPRATFQQCPVCGWERANQYTFDGARQHCIWLRQEPLMAAARGLTCPVCENRDARWPQHWGEWTGMTEAERFRHPVWTYRRPGHEVSA